MVVGPQSMASPKVAEARVIQTGAHVYVSFHQQGQHHIGAVIPVEHDQVVFLKAVQEGA
jgi:hypothetical protein